MDVDENVDSTLRSITISSTEQFLDKCAADGDTVFASFLDKCAEDGDAVFASFLDKCAEDRDTV